MIFIVMCYGIVIIMLVLCNSIWCCR